MIPSNSKEFQQSIGGKWFLDTKFLLLTTPLVITTSLLSTGAQVDAVTLGVSDSFARYAKLFLANIFALALCAVLVIPLAKTVFAKRYLRPVPILVVVLFSAAVGALKGAATGLGSWALSVEPDLLEAISSRAWQTTLLGSWLIPAMALVAARIEVLQQQRDALVAERVNATLMASGNAQNLANRSALMAFATMAKTELNKIELNASDRPNTDYANAIRKLVSEQLRPLSHRIWEKENKRTSSFAFADIVRTAVLNFTGPRALISLIYAVISIPSTLRFVPLPEALIRSIVTGLVIFLGFQLASQLKPTRYATATVWFLTTTLTVTLISFYASEGIFGFIAEFRPLETILAFWIWLTQLTFMTSFLVGVRRGRENIKSELELLHGSASIERVARYTHARIQNRDFANFLHGQVQNRLLSVALGLERGEATRQELESALQMVKSILQDVDFNFSNSSSNDLQTELNKVFSQWAGFVAIEANLPANTSKMSARTRVLVVQVIEEAIANAVRHGLARNIGVVLKFENNWKLEITDDGIGPRSGKPGLGTEFFKRVSAGTWKLEQNPNGGSTLSLTI